jgi:DNA-binding transcriptional regulator YdaS (Cro superfamily)
MAKETATQKAIRLAGGARAVAEAMGIRSLWSIYKWINRDKVPPDRVVTLEQLTKGQVTRHELRPDIFGKQPKKAAA